MINQKAPVFRMAVGISDQIVQNIHAVIRLRIDSHTLLQRIKVMVARINIKCHLRNNPVSL